MPSDSRDRPETQLGKKADAAFTEIMRGLAEIRRAVLTEHPEMLVELAPSLASVEDNVCIALKITV
jgi:hypothetical protein